jgi:hypothetical protein
VTNDRPWRLADLSFAPSGNGRERATINGVEVVRENGHRQDQRRPAESYARPGTAKEARTARQLHESDVSRRSHGVRSQAAAVVAKPVLDEIAKNER